MVSRGVVSIGRGSGGAEFVALDLAEHLAGNGEEVVLVADVHSGALDQVPELLSIAPVGNCRPLEWLVRHIPMDFSRWVLLHLLGNILAARRARLLLKQDAAGFSVVHVHGALATILLGRTVRKQPGHILLVYTEHDSTPWSCRYRRRSERMVRRCVYRQVNLRACRAAGLVVTNYPALADELADRAGLPRSRFVTVRNAVAPAFLTRGPHGAESVRARHGFARYCLYVGSLVDRKCPDVLLRALAQVGMPCIFVGDGPMRASLERLAHKAGVAERVVFTGALERHDVGHYLSGAEALVLPSVSETAALVALEALMAGVPVVASNLTSIASFVRHTENGLLVDPGDEASLVRALSLIETDKALHAKLRHGAKISGQSVARCQDVANELRVLYASHRVVPVVPRQREGAAAEVPAPVTVAQPEGAARG
jgi:glycosyltransferase involved in cell wall biosynthesis